MKPVGYLVNHRGSREGEPGVCYNYVLASNGLFIEAENKLMEVRIPVAECEVRGLAPLQTNIVLTYGSIPQRFFDLALDMFLADIDTEHYVAITGRAGYHFYVPVQEKTAAGVVYSLGDDVVLDLHSHGKLGAWFSQTDNKDETGLKLYGVAGNLERIPKIKLRVGVYGYFYPLTWHEVFDGTMNDAEEDIKFHCEDPKGEEVTRENELQGFFGADAGEFGHRSGRMWWDRWFRR